MLIKKALVPFLSSNAKLNMPFFLNWHPALLKTWTEHGNYWRLLCIQRQAVCFTWYFIIYYFQITIWSTLNTETVLLESMHVCWFSRLDPVGVARFIDASIYHDTFPAIRIVILFFTIAIFFFFFFPQSFSFRQKRDIIILISACDFCKVIPENNLWNIDQ